MQYSCQSNKIRGRKALECLNMLPAYAHTMKSLSSDAAETFITIVW